MNSLRSIAGALALMAVFVAAAPATSAADNDAPRAQFEAIVQGLNENSFERFNRAIDEKALTERIFGSRLIDTDIRKSFASDVAASIDGMFASSFPESRSDILATVISFQMQGNNGRAVVRFAASGYRYSYHVYELALGPKGRLSIVDWIDYYQGGRFSDEAGLAMVMAMPNKPATRSILEDKNLADQDVFQVGELFKAFRDRNGQRFFQIYSELDSALQRDPVIARLNLHMALQVRDVGRVERALAHFQEGSPRGALQSLKLVEFYIPARRYKAAIEALELLEQDLGVRDGAIGSLQAMAALADGDSEDAVVYAKQATEAEPTLEVAWWSLLRARTGAGDYTGAIEALTRLEDDFGENLDAQQLGKDRFLKVLADKPEYLAWRSSRN